ncbi:MAG: hypothetical protein ACRDCT_18525, partial [Shewanella sp.]
MLFDLVCKNYNALSDKAILECYIDVNNDQRKDKEASIMLASRFDGVCETYSALAIASTLSFASPNNIMVFSLK